MADNEAMRLADAVDPLTRKGIDNLTCAAAAAELRRLSAVEAERVALLALIANVRRCRYSVCTTICSSGYDWDIPRLNDVIDAAKGGEMTDRELLELAAKAAGYRVLDENVEGIDVCFERPGYLPVVIIGWNPRDDDGEAFRLAVELGLCVQVLHKYGETQVFRQTGYELEKHNSDPLAATRLAIVRAAAEIGKGMK